MYKVVCVYWRLVGPKKRRLWEDMQLRLLVLFCARPLELLVAQLRLDVARRRPNKRRKKVQELPLPGGFSCKNFSGERMPTARALRSSQFELRRRKSRRVRQAKRRAATLSKQRLIVVAV